MKSARTQNLFSRRLQEYASVPEENETFTLSDGSVLHYVNLSFAEERVRRDEPCVASALDGDSDLVPNIYEGDKKRVTL